MSQYIIWMKESSIPFLLESEVDYVCNKGLLISRLIHSKLCSITLVATKVHMISRSLVVVTWMRAKRELV